MVERIGADGLGSFVGFTESRAWLGPGVLPFRTLRTVLSKMSRRKLRRLGVAPVEPLDELLPPDLGDESALNFVTRLFHQLSGKHTPKSETPAMDPKTAEAFAAAVDKLDSVATRLEQIAPAPVEPVKTEVTSAEFNSLKASLDSLQETFNTALNQAHGKPIPSTTGPVTEELEPVY